MGDMADWTLEQGWDDFDAGLPIPRTIKHPMCRHCGKKHLRWERVGERWVLFDKKAPHRCPKHPLPLDVLKKLAEDNIREQRKKK